MNLPGKQLGKLNNLDGKCVYQRLVLIQNGNSSLLRSKFNYKCIYIAATDEMFGKIVFQLNLFIYFFFNVFKLMIVKKGNITIDSKYSPFLP